MLNGKIFDRFTSMCSCIGNADMWHFKTLNRNRKLFWCINCCSFPVFSRNLHKHLFSVDINHTDRLHTKIEILIVCYTLGYTLSVQIAWFMTDRVIFYMCDHPNAKNLIMKDINNGSSVNDCLHSLRSFSDKQ